MQAINGGHIDFAKLLIRHKADINYQNRVTRGDGWEVVHVVAGADSRIVGGRLMLWFLRHGVEFRIWVVPIISTVYTIDPRPPTHPYP